MATNIFDTRNIIRETPKIGNRFLLSPDRAQLDTIINGKAADSSSKATPAAKFKRLNSLNGGDEAVFKGKDGGNPTDVLNLSLISATIPAFEFETGDVNRFNDTVKHITKFTAPGDMSTSFYDYINGSATSIMMAWQSKVGFKLTGEINYKYQYVCDMDLFVYGPNRPGYKVNKDGIDSPEIDLLMHFKIFNAWPRSVDIGEFSYDNAEIKKVQVQFAYDMIVPYKNKTRSGKANSNYNVGLQSLDRTEVNSNFSATDNADEIYNIFVNNKGN